MTEHGFDIHILIREFENGLVLGEALLFPEISRLGKEPSSVANAIVEMVKQVSQTIPTLDMHRRHAGATPRVSRVNVRISEGNFSPKATASADPVPARHVIREGTRDPDTPIIETEFDLLSWNHGEDAQIGYIPALDLEVIARLQDDLESRVREEILFALQRTKSARLCSQLAQSQRCERIRVMTRRVEMPWKSLRRRAIESEQTDEQQKSVLDEMCTLLDARNLPIAYEMDDTVRRIAEGLGTGPSQSILLVGKPGVGKTAALHELIRTGAERGLRGLRFYETSGARIAAGQSGYGMWQERCLRLVRELMKTRAVLCVGSLLELLEVGKSETVTQGVASFLKPHLLRGDVVLIAECLPEQRSIIESRDDQLLRTFQIVEVDEPPLPVAQVILHDAAHEWSATKNVTVDDAAIERLDLLHRRYATYSAYPGRPLGFLRSMLRDSEASVIIHQRDVVTRFSKETGLPASMLDDEIALDSETIRSWFSARIIGQEAAVGQIVNVLLRVKARLTRPRRPIASLLFIGPTGVGKTELAKMLALYLFSSRDRLIRIDMSEYAEPLASTRLIGGTGDKEGLLTSRVREQPFSVVLLDEFEKADPGVFDLLLQVLGEGRLTDGKGRVADFCNTMIIMTSNLGAESFERGRAGFPGRENLQAAAKEHFVEAVRTHLRPELFNRIDSIVSFSPLSPESLLAIAAREASAIRSRDGIHQRGLNLELGTDVLEQLTHWGFDEKYGARPLKRAMEQRLLAPLAAELNRYGDATPLNLSVELANGELKVRARAISSANPSAGLVESRKDAASLIDNLKRTRREIQAAQKHDSVLKLENEIERLELLAQARLAKRRKPRHLVTETRQLKRVPILQKVMNDLTEIFELTATLEDEHLLAYVERRQMDLDQLQENIRALGESWQAWLIENYALGFEKMDEINLVIFGSTGPSMSALVTAYLDAFPGTELVEFYEILTGTGSPGANPIIRIGKDSKKISEAEFQRICLNNLLKDKDAACGHLQSATGWSRAMCLEALEVATNFKSAAAAYLNRVKNPGDYLIDHPGSVLGLAIKIRGPRIKLYYRDEAGIHLVKRKGATATFTVHTPQEKLASYDPPPHSERLESFAGRKPRRTYSLDAKTLEDQHMDVTITFPRGQLAVGLARAARQSLEMLSREKVGLEVI